MYGSNNPNPMGEGYQEMNLGQAPFNPSTFNSQIHGNEQSSLYSNYHQSNSYEYSAAPSLYKKAEGSSNTHKSNIFLTFQNIFP